jgi:hypothetical protein
MDTEFERNGSYKIDAHMLGDAFTSISRFLDEDPKIELEFRGLAGGETDRIASNSVDVLQDPLVRKKRITMISVGGSNYKADRSARMSISARDWPLPISVHATGETDRCAVLKSELDGLFTASRTRYATLYPSFRTLRLVIISGGLLLGAALTTVAMDVLKLDTIPSIVVVSVLCPVVGVALLSLRQHLFPQIVIDLGYSGELARRLASVRQVIFGLIILGLMVGVASSVIAALITG